MPVLKSGTSLSVRPIDSLTYDLFLRRPYQSWTTFVCLCSDPHTRAQTPLMRQRRQLVTLLAALMSGQSGLFRHHVALMLLVSNYFHALLPWFCSWSGHRVCLISFNSVIQKGSVLLLSPLCPIGSIIFSIIELLTVKPLWRDSKNPLPL